MLLIMLLLNWRRIVIRHDCFSFRGSKGFKICWPLLPPTKLQGATDMVMKSTKNQIKTEHFLKLLFFGRLYFEYMTFVFYVQGRVYHFSMLFSHFLYNRLLKLLYQERALCFSFLPFWGHLFFRQIPNINCVNEKLSMNHFPGTTPLVAEEIKVSLKSGLNVQRVSLTKSKKIQKKLLILVDARCYLTF